MAADTVRADGTATFSRIAGASGIASQLVMAVSVGVAVTRCSWFSWTDAELSILGMEGPARLLVRSAFILAGLLYVPFVFGLARTLPANRVTRVGVIALVLGAAALAVTGFFLRSLDMPHDVFSVAFFVLINVGLVSLGLGVAVTSRMAWGVSTVLAGVFMAVFQVVPWPWEGGAITQALVVLPWLAWTVVGGVRMLLAKQDTGERG